MSWQAYVDTNLVGTGKVTKAAILGQKGGVWAASAGYQISQEEQSAIIAIFNNPTAAQAGGVRLAGQKFLCLQASPETFLGKKQADGCIIIKTKQAILVTEYVAPTQAQESSVVVHGLAEYLKSVGF